MKLNDPRKLINSVVCGIRAEEIEEPLIQEILLVAYYRLNKLNWFCTCSSPSAFNFKTTVPAS
ncbi:MAG: DUF2200 domain-containing protein [Clostridiaceae bacterium]|nr:DUF2200 domain-containing protein [Clostridiaceae bacterium]